MGRDWRSGKDEERESQRQRGRKEGAELMGKVREGPCLLNVIGWKDMGACI